MPPHELTNKLFGKFASFDNDDAIRTWLTEKAKEILDYSNCPSLKDIDEMAIKEILGLSEPEVKEPPKLPEKLEVGGMAHPFGAADLAILNIVNGILDYLKSKE